VHAQTLQNALVLSGCGEKFLNRIFKNITNWTFDRKNITDTNET